MARNALQEAGDKIKSLAAALEASRSSEKELIRAYCDSGDQAAFAALVKRHGPLVFSVCRRTLNHKQDAEDAFQAVFIILAKHADSIARHESLPSWLHRVSYRVCMHSLRASRRRKHHEGKVSVMEPTNSACQAAWQEVQVLLDREVQLLPTKYREPFVLCCLENQSCACAARHLGIKEGTVWSRLSEARKRLQAGLIRRGIAPAVGAAAVAIGVRQASASLPVGLTTTATKAALAWRAGAIPVGIISEQVAALVRGSTVTLLVTKVKLGTVLVLLLGTIVGAAGLYTSNDGPRSTQVTATKEKPVRNHKPVEAPGRPRIDLHGDPLPEDAVARLGTGRFRHGEQIYDLAYSPDGKQIASASADRTVRLWDCATGKELRRFVGHEDSVWFVAFADGGKKLISASGTWHRNYADTSVRLWDVSTGLEIRKLMEHKHRTSPAAAALSPDGRTLAFGARGTIRLLPVDGEKDAIDISVPGAPALSFPKVLRFSRDGRRLAAIVEFTGVHLFDVATKNLLWRNADHPTDALSSDSGIAFSPDSKTVATVTAVRKPLRLFDVETGTVLRSFDGPLAAGPLTFSADGSRIFSGSWSSEAVVWDVSLGKPAGKLTRRDYSSAAALSPDGAVLASAGARSIHFYDASLGNRLNSVKGANGAIDYLHLSADGQYLYAGSSRDYESGLRSWDLKTGAQILAFKRASAITLAPDGRSVAMGFYEGIPEIIDAATAKTQLKTSGKSRYLDSVCYSPSGRLLVGANWTTTDLYLWDISTGKELDSLAILPKTGGPKCLEAGPAGRLVAEGSLDGTVRLWDIESRQQANQLKGMNGPIMGVSWAPNGAELAAVSAESKMPGGFSGGKPDRYVRIWDVASGKLRLSMQGSQEGNWCVRWSHDGRLIAAGGEDGVVRVWERASGEERCRLTGHEGPIHSLAFSLDNSQLFSGSSDTTILVWDITSPRKQPLIATADDLPLLWKELGAEAPVADRAIRILIGVPELALRLTSNQLHPIANANIQHIARLVADLDAAEFATREQASRELEEMGELTAGWLRKALETQPSPELRTRVNGLLAKLENGLLTGERLREARAVEVLERISTPDARQLLEKVAAGAPEALLTREAKASLARLAKRQAK